VGPLLSDEPVVGAFTPQRLLDQRLGVAVGVGHHVGSAVLVLQALSRPPKPGEQELAGLARDALGQRKILRELAQSDRTMRTTTTTARATPAT
jgi:hypothetical protein